MLSDKDSVWHSFRTKQHMSVMAAEARKTHPSRDTLYALAQLLSAHNVKYHILDIGTVSMVDYQKLKKLNLPFKYTGIDIAENIVKDSQQYLTSIDDAIIQWNIENNKISDLVLERAPYDIINVRHVINHCSYYQQPLLNMKELLHNDGAIILTLHLICINGIEDKLETHRNWETDRTQLFGETIGNYYSRVKLKNFLEEHFELYFWAIIEDNEVIILQKKK